MNEIVLFGAYHKHRNTIDGGDKRASYQFIIFRTRLSDRLWRNLEARVRPARVCPSYTIFDM